MVGVLPVGAGPVGGGLGGVGISSYIFEEGGGFLFTLDVAGLLAGRYNVFAGANGDTTDAACYGFRIPDGFDAATYAHGYAIPFDTSVLGAVGTFATPKTLARGGPYFVTLKSQATGVVTYNVATLTIVPRWFRSRVYTLRQRFAARWLNGPRSPVNEP